MTATLSVRLTPADRDLIVSAVRQAKDSARLDGDRTLTDWLDILELRLELAEFAPDRTTTPQPCRNGCRRIPSGVPRHADEFGAYVICPTCENSQDDESTPTEN